MADVAAGTQPKVLYYRLGLVVAKAGDCGAHEWYNVNGERDACYHCRTERPRLEATSN
jgi:hypothetical protein